MNSKENTIQEFLRVEGTDEFAASAFGFFRREADESVAEFRQLCGRKLYVMSYEGDSHGAFLSETRVSWDDVSTRAHHELVLAEWPPEVEFVLLSFVADYCGLDELLEEEPDTIWGWSDRFSGDSCIKIVRSESEVRDWVIETLSTIYFVKQRHQETRSSVGISSLERLRKWREAGFLAQELPGLLRAALEGAVRNDATLVDGFENRVEEIVWTDDLTDERVSSLVSAAQSILAKVAEAEEVEYKTLIKQYFTALVGSRRVKSPESQVAAKQAESVLNSFEDTYFFVRLASSR